MLCLQWNRTFLWSHVLSQALPVRLASRKQVVKIMFPKISLIVAVSFALTIPGRVAGNEPKKDGASPEAVSEKALKALKEDRLEDFAGVMYPDALKRLKALLIAVVDA